MHLEEHQQHNKQGEAEDEDNEPQGCMNISSPSSVDNPCDFPYLNNQHLNEGNQNGEQQIEEEEEKVLPIVESYAVVDPRAVVVHI